ncbi:MAG TPA: DUF4411 family protein [Clostridia bacterium]|nr:DUF4411 family protein [Clostridia bacterium]
MESAKNEFADIADSWLCALAMTYNYVIVTQETYKPDIKKRLKYQMFAGNLIFLILICCNSYGKSA